MDWGLYIGIPFEWHGRTLDGVDCYGLIYLIYESRGIQLRDYAYLDNPNMQPLFSTGLDDSCWTQVDAPQPFDAVVLRISGHPLHCGIVVDAHTFIHARAGINSCLERLDGPVWRNRIWGFYHYVG